MLILPGIFPKTTDNSLSLKNFTLKSITERRPVCEIDLGRGATSISLRHQCGQCFFIYNTFNGTKPTARSLTEMPEHISREVNFRTIVIEDFVTTTQFKSEGPETRRVPLTVKQYTLGTTHKDIETTSPFSTTQPTGATEEPAVDHSGAGRKSGAERGQRSAVYVLLTLFEQLAILYFSPSWIETHTMSTPPRDPWLVSKTFALAGVSNMVSGAITHPIDVVKVRMQCDPGRGAARQYSGLVSGAARLLGTEGPKVLFTAGLLPSLCREASYSTIRMGGYEPVKRFIHKGNDQGLPLYKKVFAGATSGLAGAFFTTPFDLVKVRLQTDIERRLPNTFVLLYRIWGEGGVRALWRGVGPNLGRGCTTTAAQQQQTTPLMWSKVECSQRLFQLGELNYTALSRSDTKVRFKRLDLRFLEIRVLRIYFWLIGPRSKVIGVNIYFFRENFMLTPITFERGP
eukprot:sb/3464541/